MTDITPPPPHLLKKFSEQARVSSQKRGAPNYLKTFAILCIEWAMNSQSTPNDRQIRSSDITPPPELVQQWRVEAANRQYVSLEFDEYIAEEAAQWGADQELEACCKMLYDRYDRVRHATGFPGSDICDWLRAARRPKPQTLNSIALQMLGTIERDAHYLPEITDTIRRALGALPE